MSVPRAMHGTFTVERRYEAAPARVFAAFADPAVKARWFIGPPESWKILKREGRFFGVSPRILHGYKVKPFASRKMALPSWGQPRAWIRAAF